MFVMTVKTRRISKKHGDIMFIFFIILLLFSSLLFEISFSYLMKTYSYFTNFSFSFYAYIVTCLASVYMLVGTRLLYIRKHISNEESFIGNNMNNDYFDHAINIIDFIPLKRNTNYLFSLCNGIKKQKYLSNDTIKSFEEGKLKLSEEDSIEQNTNNYFFNQALKKLEEEK